MMQNLDLDIVGCQLNLIDVDGKYLGYRNYPTGNDSIRKSIYFKNVFAHNSIIVKKSFLIQVGGYKNGIYTEDYDLWLRLFSFTKIRCGNLDNQLVRYRLHSMGAQRKIYPYAEVCGYLMRELMVNFKMMVFLGLITAIIKRFVRSKGF
jgi:hypothetical protein